jgi:hypothetical protein
VEAAGFLLGLLLKPEDVSDMFFRSVRTEEVGLEVSLYTTIRVVLGSNLGLDISCLG